MRNPDAFPVLLLAVVIGSLVLMYAAAMVLG